MHALLLKLHRWAGLLAGIIVFVVGVRKTYYAYASILGAIGGKNL